MLVSSVLSTLLYFDYFKHPLTASEVHQFLDTNLYTSQEIQYELAALTALGIVQEKENYYFLSSETLVDFRKKRELLATQYWKKALSYSRLISKFPYVRGVFISGSLSKNCMDEDGDIDYFIVTQPERLWVCRTLLIAFKKLFLLNSKKYFCVNYFVDEAHLQITDKNLFVATELLTMKPLFQHTLFQQTMEANLWAKTLLPNYPIVVEAGNSSRKPWHKSVLEGVLNTRLGKGLDNFFHRLTFNRWQHKFAHLSDQDFEVAFRSLKHTSKHHPHQYQKRVLAFVEEQLKILLAHPKLKEKIAI